MAVNKQIKTSSLSIEVQNGVDKASDPIFTKKTFANVRNNVDASNVYAVAEAVKGVLTNDTRDYSLVDLMIQKNVFFTSSGALVKKSGAQITEKNVKKIEIA